MTVKLIVALDYRDKKQALALVEQLDPEICALKVGSEMYALFGADFVRSLVSHGFKVFLDLKFHDIPNTVVCACLAAADLGVWMLNVHASGGFKMMRAARSALDSLGHERPLLIAVTVLTSMEADELREIGIHSPLNEQVCRLARLSVDAGLDGVVCSALEVPAIKRLCGPNFLTICPGIRMAEHEKNDQARVIGPIGALRAGSDYLVIGRPITKADKPIDVVKSLLLAIKTVE